MGERTVVALDGSTWDLFADLVERHGGVSGGCWCTWFQTVHAEKTFTAEGNRETKHRLVLEGRAHAALVVDDGRAVAWAQYGTADELPNIYHRREYEAALDPTPDARITCIFVDRTMRRQGLSLVALHGALQLIGRAGGGVVEGYPHDTGGARTANLYDGTRTLFERAGFDWIRAKGQRNCVMRRHVAAVG